MTRKQYIKKVQQLELAIFRHPESTFPEGYKVGNATRHTARATKSVPKGFKSYQEAWDSEPMRWAREYYGVN